MILKEEGAHPKFGQRLALKGGKSLCKIWISPCSQGRQILSESLHSALLVRDYVKIWIATCSQGRKNPIQHSALLLREEGAYVKIWIAPCSPGRKEFIQILDSALLSMEEGACPKFGQQLRLREEGPYTKFG